jgi:hypothetical protein
MIYSSTHGDMAFTVPLFDEFMRRAIPEFEERQWGQESQWGLAPLDDKNR